MSPSPRDAVPPFARLLSGAVLAAACGLAAATPTGPDRVPESGASREQVPETVSPVDRTADRTADPTTDRGSGRGSADENTRGHQREHQREHQRAQHRAHRRPSTGEDTEAHTRDTAAIVAAARALAAADPWPTLISVDSEGRPRARTVEASALQDAPCGLEVWVATNPESRKVAQIRAHPRVTLHWADDAAGSYVTLLGTATLHDDAATIAAHTFTTPQSLRAFWPDWPEGYLLVRIVADRIEALGGDLAPDPVTWAPAGADLRPHPDRAPDGSPERCPNRGPNRVPN